LTYLHTESAELNQTSQYLDIRVETDRKMNMNGEKGLARRRFWPISRYHQGKSGLKYPTSCPRIELTVSRIRITSANHLTATFGKNYHLLLLLLKMKKV